MPSPLPNLRRCILHNFVQKTDGINYEDAETHPFADVDDLGIRDPFFKYFITAAAVDFQTNYMFNIFFDCKSDQLLF